MDIARRWLRREYISPETIRYAVEKIKDKITEQPDMPEGQIMFLSHLAGQMNQDAVRCETNRIRREEGLV